MRLLVYIFCVICLLPACAESSFGPMQELRQVTYDKSKSVPDFINKIKQHYQLPALAVAEISGTGDITSSVIGFNRSKDGIELNHNSKFQIGSCGKSFTSLLAGILVNEGKLNWDTSLVDVFPTWKQKMHPQYKHITLIELLSHTSGVRSFSSDEEFFNLSNLVPDLTGSVRDQRHVFTQWVLQQDPISEIGEFNYSNAGYVIAATMLEQRTGLSYEQLIQQKIFAVYELNSAEFGYPFMADESQPWRHYRRDHNGHGISLSKTDRLINPIFNPAGNISLTIDDFANYINVHAKALQNQNPNDHDKLIVKLHKPIVQRVDDQYALGWALRHFGNTIISTHSGSDQSIFAMMSIDQSTGKAIAVTTNIGGSRAEMALINVVLELMH